MRPCTCRICTNEPDDVDTPANRTVIENVGTHGWHSYHVAGSWVSWLYSMGFEHSYDQPEVVMSGFGQSDMALMTRKVAEYFAEGGEYAEDRTLVSVGDDELGLHAVHPDWLHTELFLGAEWFNRGISRASQIVLLSEDPPWPKQPRFWLPPAEQSIEWRAFVSDGDVEWRHPLPWKTPVLVSQSIMRRGEWIFSVFHDHADDWQCLDGYEFTADDLELVPLSAILERDPAVAGLLDMPRGERAWRERPDAPWQRATFEPPEE
jgi:hypothetical protein